MSTCTYNLRETIGADMASRYSVNGIRVSRDKFNEIRDRASQSGRLDCFSTKCKQIGKKFRRINFSVASFNY